MRKRAKTYVGSLLGVLALVAVGTSRSAWCADHTAASKGILYAAYKERRAVNIDDRTLTLAKDARIVDRRGGVDVEIGYDRLMQVPKPVAVQYRFRYTNRRIEVIELALTRGRGR